MPLYEHNLKPTPGEDMIRITTQQTAGYFPSAAGTIDAALIYTGSLSDTNEEYYINISDKNPTSASATDIYSIAYGHIAGSGSKVQANTIGETEAIYKQWGEILLAPSEITGGFTISQQGSEGIHYSSKAKDADIYVLVGKRSLYKERVNKKNWTIYLSGSNTVGTAGVLHDWSFTDDSETVVATATPAGPRYNIISGSNGAGGTAATTRTFGWFYPDMGVWVFSGAELSASLPGYSGTTSLVTTFAQNRATSSNGVAIETSQSAGFGPNATSAYNAYNAMRFVNCTRKASSTAFKMRSEENVNSVAYMCRLKAMQANFSTNHTFTSGSFNEIRAKDMKGNPQTFVTGIGLVDNTNTVVAVAKLSTAVQKNFSSEATFKVKLSY